MTPESWITIGATLVATLVVVVPWGWRRSDRMRIKNEKLEEEVRNLREANLYYRISIDRFQGLGATLDRTLSGLPAPEKSPQ